MLTDIVDNIIWQCSAIHRDHTHTPMMLAQNTKNRDRPNSMLKTNPHTVSLMLTFWT